MSDVQHRKEVQMEFEVPGTPEQIWQAIATGPGISCWLFPTTVEERVGGAVEMQIGPGLRSDAVVNAWEPPHRFGYDEPNWAPGAPPLGTEFTIETRSGDTCVVRLVHSLFTDSSDWDEQIASFETGWPGFFDVLRVYMTHFAGLTCAPMRLMGDGGTSEEETWEGIKEALGLTGAQPGSRATASGEGFPALGGIVDRLGLKAWKNELMLVLDQPCPGIALMGTYSWGGGVHAAFSLYFYGPTAADTVATNGTAWQDWFAARYPARDWGGAE